MERGPWEYEGQERMVWRSVDPAPYESAWCIFLKLIALNYCRPAFVARKIKRREFPTLSELPFEESHWIDFKKFSSLLRVDHSRLRAGFLDQLGFPFSGYKSGSIRVCNECLKHGYHCTFFLLPLVKECPIHHVALEEACTRCSRVVFKTGLKKRTISKLTNRGGILDPGYDQLEYASECRHISFYPYRYLNPEPLDSDAIIRLQTSCEALVDWWQKVFTSLHSEPDIVHILAHRTYEVDDPEELKLAMDIARFSAGECPWSVSIQPLPATLIKFPQHGVDDRSRPSEIELSSDLGRIYRSIRRHIFKRYIKPGHWNCWRFLSKFKLYMSRALGNHSPCTVVLAYMSWRMTLEGFSNIEAFGEKRKVSKGITPFPISVSAQSPQKYNEVASFWYADFFAILGKIETQIRSGGHFYIDRRQGTFEFSGFAHLRECQQRMRVTGEWQLLFYNKEVSLRNAAIRCLARGRHLDRMFSIPSFSNMQTWEWTGYYSERNQSALLFRIRDDKSYINSYDHLTF